VTDLDAVLRGQMMERRKNLEDLLVDRLACGGWLSFVQIGWPQLGLIWTRF